MYNSTVFLRRLFAAVSASSAFCCLAVNAEVPWHALPSGEKARYGRASRQ